MRLTLLALQRKGLYPGEYGPEILACCDEATHEENPEWWPVEVERQRGLVGDEVEAWGQLVVEVPDYAIRKALGPVVVADPLRVVAGDE